MLVANEAPAQMAMAGETILFTTKESVPHADTTRIYTVLELNIEGNKRTRDKVILRELPFEEGGRYSLADLAAGCTEARGRLMNTQLFLDVVVGISSTQRDEARVLVTVRERWYFIPRPVLDIVGSTYQKWVSDGMPLANVRYGVNIKHKNLSGLNDRLSVNLTNGYQKEIGLVYEGLPLDYGLHWTFNFAFQMGQQRDLVYATHLNKPVGLHSDKQFIYGYTHAQASVVWRPAIKTRHQFGFAWHDERFDDTIAKLSQKYFNNRNAVRYPEIFYNASYLDLDFAPYPTRGIEAEAGISKKGFGGPVNLWQLMARASWYKPLSKRAFINLRGTGMVKLPFHQPYRMQGFVGYNSMFIQGYEPYTIDGVAGGFFKASIHRRIIDTKIGIHWKRFPQLANIPIKIYAKAFANAGYIYTEDRADNFLNNRLLTSAGLGLDLLLFYDFTFRIECTLNGNGQNGLYLHDRNRW
jgi:outer membrane protein assembly factor BamA